MNQQADVKSVDVLQNTLQELQEEKNQITRLIQEDLNDQKNLLEATQQEVTISNNMLMVAKVIESEKRVELMSAEADLAAAIATGLPDAIAAASSWVASATQEYHESKSHRERLDYRYDLAKECVSIAEYMVIETERMYSLAESIISEKLTIGTTRLINAKNDLLSYLNKTFNSIPATDLSDKTKTCVLGSENQKEIKLSSSEHQQIKHETGWSDFVINHIRTMEQYEIYYKQANLTEKIVNGRICLIREIDFDYIDPKSGMTNKELMAMGRAPFDSKTGQRIELHHMDQDFAGPFAELTENTEHGDGNQTKLHFKGSDSWRNDPVKNNKYKNHDRPDHWRARAKEK